MGAAMKTWRCAICKEEGRAPDDRTAERAMVIHWRVDHFNVRRDRDADHPADS